VNRLMERHLDASPEEVDCQCELYYRVNIKHCFELGKCSGMQEGLRHAWCA
jgi:hypothetical protein